MCGFFGIFKQSLEAFPPEKEKELIHSLSHRGPDDFQIFSGKSYQVMFWRLSIVDEAGGKQPMNSPDGKKTLLFNGEIYNYQALRENLKTRGYKFKTESDTEVILTAYEAWGISSFSLFEGMFSICLIDNHLEKIFLARDRLGVKPLYFHKSSEHLMIASEQKAILSQWKHSPKLDKTAFSDYLVFQTVLGTRTLFDGISKVPPGTILEFGLDQNQLLDSHPIKSSVPDFSCTSYPEYRLATRNEILKQTTLAFNTQLPICFHLSGGIDSNSLIGLHRLLDPARDFVCISSLIDGDNDPESAFIYEAARYHKSPLQTVNLQEQNFFNALDDVIYYLDEPVGDPGVIAQFLVNQLASGISKIIYSGQGFDELFFGYIRDLATYILSKFGHNALSPNENSFDQIHPNTRPFLKGWESFIDSMVKSRSSPELALFKKLCRFNPLDFSSDFENSFSATLQNTALNAFISLKEKTSSLHDFILEAETTIQLPSLLHMEDRASMRYSLETRVPFCTNSILSVARQSEMEWKFFKGQPKGVLRDILSDIIPPAILNRKEKIGRPIPFKKWLSGKYGAPYLNELKENRKLFLDLTHTDFLKSALNNPNPFDRSLWASLSILRWIKIFKVSV